MGAFVHRVRPTSNSLCYIIIPLLAVVLDICLRFHCARARVRLTN